MFKNFDFIIVGAGLFGSVLAERLAHSGYRICIIEKRNHIGGNCHDQYDQETGILFPTYGPHIFHTDNLEVIHYIKNFAEFNRYFHQVLAQYQEKIYQLPFNLETINSFYNLNLKPFEISDFLSQETKKENIQNPRNMEEKAISLVGRPLYESFIKSYTIKQWGKDPSQLSADLITRIPVRNNYYESYFEHSFQGMPIGGYTKIFEKLLSSPHINILLNTDYIEVRDLVPSDKVLIFTGPLDQFHNYKYGRLEYRTLNFEREIYPVTDWQGTSVINYPEPEYPYTRICEPKHFYREEKDKYDSNKTIIFKEFSNQDNGSSPYYPLSDIKNLQLSEKYKAEHKNNNVFLSGRLGEYKYYDMDSTIKSALDLSRKLLTEKNNRNCNKF